MSSPTAAPHPGRALVGLVLVPSVAVAVGLASLYFVVMPLLPVVSHYYFSQQEATFAREQLPLYGHIAFGSVALALGAVNIVTALRGRRLRRHPVIGRVYAVAVSGAAVCAAVLAFSAYAGTLPGGRIVVTSGFLALAVLWVGTLALAVRAIAVRHDERAHRFWMTINFSLTFAAVTLRLYVGVLLALGTPAFDLLYPTLGWLGWLPNVVVATVLARRVARRR
jgi:hypothetical protein